MLVAAFLELSPMDSMATSIAAVKQIAPPRPSQDEVQGGQEHTARIKGGASGSLVEQGLQAKRGDQGPMRADGNRNELDAERDRHRDEVEELGRNVNLLATKWREREEELESLRANTSSYIGNILVQEAGQGGGGKVNDIFDATLMRAPGNRNKLDTERDRHREEVEEPGGDVNALATK